LNFWLQEIRMWKRLSLAVLAILGAAVPLHAQAEPDSVKLRNDCRLAVQVTLTGNPAPRREWARWAIMRCGAEGGRVIAQAIRANKSSSDTALLNRITWPAFELRDGNVFLAAYEVLGDKSATPQARVFAVRTLLLALRPNSYLTYPDLADETGGRQRTCYGSGGSFHLVVHPGTPLPPDYDVRVREIGARLAADASEPRAVRRAAACLIDLRPDPLLDGSSRR
jgi:hypothetical protein